MTAADLDLLRSQLAAHEGYRLVVYNDTLGIPTIGVGRNLRDKGLTPAEVTFLLNGDIEECLTDLRTYGWWAALDAVRQRALIDLRFNLGPYRFRTFKKMLSACEESNWEGAAAQLVDSDWAIQVQPSRRDRLVRMLRTGKD